MIKNKSNQLTVKSRTENLSEIRDFIKQIAEQAGMVQDQADKVMLAVDEACTNIIKHAYRSIPDGEIHISISYSDKKFVVKIKDYGTSFEANSIPEPDLQKYYREKRVGGLGMYLMKTLMDEVKYVSIPGKYNQVLLSKNINAAQS